MLCHEDIIKPRGTHSPVSFLRPARPLPWEGTGDSGPERASSDGYLRRTPGMGEGDARGELGAKWKVFLCASCRPSGIRLN